MVKTVHQKTVMSCFTRVDRLQIMWWAYLTRIDSVAPGMHTFLLCIGYTYYMYMHTLNIHTCTLAYNVCVYIWRGYKFTVHRPTCYSHTFLIMWYAPINVSSLCKLLKTFLFGRSWIERASE